METFYQSFLPPVVSICGYKLNEFSYNHLTILRAIKSPFTDAGERGLATSADLIIALKVCSGKYPDKDFTFTRKDRLRAFILGRQRARLITECINFSAYISCHQQGPEFWEFKDKGWTPASSPDELSTVALLIKNNIEHGEAWNMSIGYANWLSAVILEQAGNPRVFVNDDNDDTINLNSLPEEEVVNIAKENLPPDRFKQWLKARKERGA